MIRAKLFEYRNHWNRIGPAKKVWIWMNYSAMDHIRSNIAKTWSIGVTPFVLKIRAIFVLRLSLNVWNIFSPQNNTDKILSNIFGMFIWCYHQFIGAKPIVIVSDIRRKSDIKFFQTNGYHIKTIRINASVSVRQSRGWKFELGVDDHQSECDLDDYIEWDLIIDNDDQINLDASIQNVLSLLP